MSIQEHYLTEDLDRVHEHLLNLHNLSIAAIKDAQEGKFDDMQDYQYRITRSIKMLAALYHKKRFREDSIFK